MNTSQQLRGLYDPAEQHSMLAVKEALLRDPKALDTHSREKRSPPVEEKK